jgi:hypothetical protein
MAPDQTDVWFSPNVEYEGHGRAEFSHPRGYVEGPVKIRFDEFGEGSVELVIENIETERTLQFGLFEFFIGSEPVQVGDTFGMHFRSDQNPCVRLEVDTPQGAFTATDQIHYAYSNAPSASGNGSRLSLYPVRSRFVSANLSLPRYWVLPLTNLLCDFHRHDSPLDGHPLRIWQKPVIPEGLSEEQASTDRLLAEWQDRLIVFGFNGRLGFIEPLPDYEERASSLLNGRERHRLTAVMVGELGDDIVDPYEDHFPLNVLRVLSFATGVEVGSPWMEFRDSEGSLVSRSHAVYERSGFSEGRAVINESLHFGIGRMLNGFLILPEDQCSRIRPAMDEVTQSGLHNRTIEDKLTSLFKGLDGLSKSYGLGQQNLQKRLSQENRDRVKQALKRAARDIQVVADAAAASGDHEQSRVLARIADRTTSTPMNIDGDFGLAVVDLLEHFGFPDADIVDRYYEKNPRADERKWHQMLSLYRGIVTHEGPLTFPGGDPEIKDVLCLFVHLHDLLVRVILKMISYDGTYNPWVTKQLEKKAVDWVTPATDASELGYEESVKDLASGKSC